MQPTESQYDSYSSEELHNATRLLSVNPINPTLTAAPDSDFRLRRRVDLTIDAIKSYIIHEQLQPGDPLPTESTLCERLQASRSSIREAMRKLEALDIVSVVQGKGTFVGGMSLEPLVETLSFRSLIPQHNSYTDLKDVIELRRIIDLGCAQQVVDAVSQLDAERIAHLRATVDAMKAHAHQGHNFLAEDIAFHMGLLAPISNAVVKQLTHSLWVVHMAVLPALGLQTTASLESSVKAHSMLLESAIAGDLESYREAIDLHYQPIEEIIHSLDGKNRERAAQSSKPDEDRA